LALDYKKQQKQLSLIIGLELLMLVFLSIVTTILSNHLLMGFDFGFFVPILNLIIFIVCLALVTQFVVLMYSIGLRFEKMNSCMENSIVDLANIHLKVAECVKIFNSVYGFPIMGIMTVAFIWCCISASTIIITPKEQVLLLIYITFSHNSAIFTLCVHTFAAERILSAKSHAIELLYQKMSQEVDVQKEQYFIMQIRHTNVEFSCKFFEFNWKLIFRFITACVMYFIIIVHFEKSI
jgi:hypothetical protein